MCADFSSVRRVLHWGPLTTLGIIKFVTLTTLYINSLWWPPNRTLNGFLHQALFLFLSSVATFNYVLAMLTGPGFLPKQWKPKNARHIVHLQYCKMCEGYKAPRSHHCRRCGRCVKKMDHHCPWINNCVGWSNHANFIYFLFFSILGSMQATIILGNVFWYGIINRFWFYTVARIPRVYLQLQLFHVICCILALGLAFGVVCALSMLLCFQLKTVFKNETGIESWIIEKAIYRRMLNPNLQSFMYPYNVGWWKNVRQVFNSQCLNTGEGIVWPVIPGCDQYTLTREQLAQKTEKRARTRVYRCIRSATGSWIPLFSQGIRVCIAAPCTDEPRIRLEVDDLIRVTRFREHWLFGERVVVEKEDGKNIKADTRESIRGWFPRRCALELIQSEPNPPARQRPHQRGVSADIFEEFMDDIPQPRPAGQNVTVKVGRGNRRRRRNR